MSALLAPRPTPAPAAPPAEPVCVCFMIDRLSRAGTETQLLALIRELDRTKLERSVSIACRKRPVEQDRIDKLVSSIQRQLETSGESEMASSRIGEMVMNGLKALDTVAYIRFASVYKDFREAKDFEDFAGTVGE